MYEMLFNSWRVQYVNSKYLRVFWKAGFHLRGGETLLFVKQGLPIGEKKFFPVVTLIMA